MSVPYCVHCGAENPSGGYCWRSPDGEHAIAIDYDSPNPDDCCSICGEEFTRAEIDGFADHVCDPDLVAAEKRRKGE